MGLLLVIVLLTASGSSVLALLRRLRRLHVGLYWWLAFGILAACGAALGIWGAFYFEYAVGARHRIGGFPIPVVFFQLEEGHWVDYVVPEIQAWSSAFANILTLIAFATLPLWLVTWRHRQLQKLAL